MRPRTAGAFDGRRERRWERRPALDESSGIVTRRDQPQALRPVRKRPVFDDMIDDGASEHGLSVVPFLLLPLVQRREVAYQQVDEPRHTFGHGAGFGDQSIRWHLSAEAIEELVHHGRMHQDDDAQQPVELVSASHR
jgi:hypothetical protein